MIFEHKNKKYELKYNFSATRNIEKRLNTTISNIDECIDKMDTVSIIFNEGLSHHGDNLTIETTDSMLDDLSNNGFLSDVVQSFSNQVGSFFKKPDDEDKKK